jgi:hypothetical protein
MFRENLNSILGRLLFSTVRVHKWKLNELWTYYCVATPLTAGQQQLFNSSLRRVQWRCSRSAWTLNLPDYDRYDKEQISLLTLLEARWHAQQALGASKRVALCTVRSRNSIRFYGQRSPFLVHTALQFWPILSLVEAKPCRLRLCSRDGTTHS